MALFETLIAANRFKSVLLVGGFILFYTGVLFALAVGAVAIVFGYPAAAHWRTLALVAAGAHAAAVLLAVAACSGGSHLVLSVSRAQPLAAAADPELHHLVEEMALAAGMPAPRLYLIESAATNALATAGSRGRAAVVLTRGLRDRLDRDQLQAVVAYQLARIRSDDIHLMTLIAGLVGLMALMGPAVRWTALGLALAAPAISAADVARSVIRDMLYSTPSDGSPGATESSMMVLFWVVFFVPIGLIVLLTSPAIGRLIQRCVSRERQFLADAEAARLTRYPDALARALEIMAAGDTPLATASPATAHLFIVAPRMPGGRAAGGRGVWSSHPPIEERVARLRSIGNIEA